MLFLRDVEFTIAEGPKLRGKLFLPDQRNEKHSAIITMTGVGIGSLL